MKLGNTVVNTKNQWRGISGWTRVEKGKSGLAKCTGFSLNKPKSGEYVKCNLRKVWDGKGYNKWRVQLEVDRGFMNEKLAPKAEAAQRKAYKDRQKFARDEGLYREYYIGNQFKTDPSARVLKPNSPEGKAFIKEAKPAPKPTLGGRDNGGGTPRCPDGTLPPCKLNIPKPQIPMGKAKVQPKMFEFNFNQGGLVRGAGKILKDRNRKVRIF